MNTENRREVTVTPAQIGRMMQTTPQVLRLMLSGVEEAQLVWRPEPDSWCIKEIIGHLLDADRWAFAGRIQLILREERPTLGGRPADMLGERNDVEKSLKELLNELEYQREEYGALVAQLTEEQLARKGVYPPHGELTAGDFAYEWGYHDHEHIKEIAKILRMQIWPYLGEVMQNGVQKP